MSIKAFLYRLEIIILNKHETLGKGNRNGPPVDTGRPSIPFADRLLGGFDFVGEIAIIGDTDMNTADFIPTGHMRETLGGHGR